ncbi:hypothetical protein SSPS47_34790 [Streptomyces sp. S4.7]|nr:hypothetical protein SSPS47_34790 [Streptomyces sp. S4.7]
MAGRDSRHHGPRDPGADQRPLIAPGEGGAGQQCGVEEKDREIRQGDAVPPGFEIEGGAEVLGPAGPEEYPDLPALPGDFDRHLVPVLGGEGELLPGGRVLEGDQHRDALPAAAVVHGLLDRHDPPGHPDRPLRPGHPGEGPPVPHQCQPPDHHAPSHQHLLPVHPRHTRPPPAPDLTPCPLVTNPQPSVASRASPVSSVMRPTLSAGAHPSPRRPAQERRKADRAVTSRSTSSASLYADRPTRRPPVSPRPRWREASRA